MDALLGVVAILLLLGFGSKQWRLAVKGKLDEKREDRRFRRKYGL